MAILHTVFVHPGQSADFDRIQSVGPKRFRVRIRRDSYVGQSYAVCEVWRGHEELDGGWVQVLSIPGADPRVEGLPTSYAIRGTKDATDGKIEFNSLANDMIDIALKIVR